MSTHWKPIYQPGKYEQLALPCSVSPSAPSL